MSARREEVRPERPLASRPASIREVCLVGSFGEARRYEHRETARSEDRRVKVGAG